jgi:hypothetical protein
MLNPFSRKHILIHSDSKEEVEEVQNWFEEAERNLNIYERLLNHDNNKSLHQQVDKSLSVDGVIFLTLDEMEARPLPRTSSRRYVQPLDKDILMKRTDGIINRAFFGAEDRMRVLKEMSRHLELSGHCEIISDIEFRGYFPSAQTDRDKYQVVFLCIEACNSFLNRMYMVFNTAALEQRVERYFHVRPSATHFSTIMCGRLNYITKLIFLHECGHALCNHNERIDTTRVQEEAEATFFGSIFLFSNIDSLFYLFVLLLNAEAYDRIILIRLGYLTYDGTFSASNRPDAMWDAFINKKYLL